MLLANFVIRCRGSLRRWWQLQANYHFIWGKVVFTLSLFSRDSVKRFERNRTNAPRPGDINVRAQCHQYRCDGRRTREVRVAVGAQNRMITIVALQHQGLSIRIQREQSIAIAEIPAAGTLAEISAQGCHISDLWAGCIVD